MLEDAIRKFSKEEQIYMLNMTNNISRGTLVEVHISDLHFGALDPKYQYEILEQQFLMKLEQIMFHIVCIDGDLFDHKYMSNSDVVMYASKFFNRLVNICRVKGATLIILHGTLEHDANQLKLFYHYITDPTVDVRIVEQVQFEYVKGAKILCIPELYGKGHEYYEQFLFNSGLYDTVFMHGEIKGSIYRGANKVEPTLDTDKSPIFTIEDFRMCLGPIISGHIHTASCYDGYFYYCGSPYRWKFGEEQEKGFLIVLQNLDTSEHYVHLEPIQSYRYDTVDLETLLLQDPKTIIDYTNNLLNNGVDFIRLQYKGYIDDDKSSKLELIKNYFRNYNNVKIHVDRKKNAIIANQQELSDKYKEYDYILDSNLDEYQILTKYINQQQGYEYISVQELKDLLSE